MFFFELTNDSYVTLKQCCYSNVASTPIIACMFEATLLIMSVWLICNNL